jgi:transcriptional regulator with XRE-family HTH domain
MSNKNPSLQQTIDFLRRDKGLKVNELVEALEVERIVYYNVLKGSNEQRKKEFVAKLFEKFPVELQEIPPEEPSRSQLEHDYIQTLKRENELLRRLNERDLADIKREIEELKNRFPQ